MKILVVDDEGSILYLLERFLLKKGHEVIATTSVVDALKYIDSEDFDIILLDMKMRPMGGLEMIKYLRKIDFRGKILVMTTFINEYISQLKELDVDTVLEKPFSLDYLYKKICVEDDAKSRI